MNCPFCNPDVIRKQTFHTTERFNCFFTHKPVLPGHTLIIPKRHVESITEMSDAEMTELALILKTMSVALMDAYGGTGVDIALQNGETAGASVAHLHWHIIPRKAGDIDGDPSLWMAKVVEAERGRAILPDSELQANIQKIRRVMQQLD